MRSSNGRACPCPPRAACATCPISSDCASSENSTVWRVVTVKDYIANSKPNGYRSLHVILALPFGVGGIEEIRTEIQLRTIAMDCWASLEHQLKYKKNIGNTELIVSELKRCADEMASTDLSMQTIRDLIHKGD